MGIQSECIFAMVHLPQECNFLSPPSLLTVIPKGISPFTGKFLLQVTWTDVKCSSACCLVATCYPFCSVVFLACLKQPEGWNHAINNWGRKGQHIATKEYPYATCIGCAMVLWGNDVQVYTLAKACLSAHEGMSSHWEIKIMLVLWASWGVD